MTVVQPHLQIFSLLLLSFRLNSGMLGFFCLNLRALSGFLQTVSHLPVQPDPPYQYLFAVYKSEQSPPDFQIHVLGTMLDNSDWHHSHL